MKIALVSRFYNRHQGIPHDVVELAERFAKKHEVHVFSQTREDGNNPAIIFHKVPLVPSKSYFMNEFYFFFLAGIMLRFHRFDAVNIHDAVWYDGGFFTTHMFPRAGVEAMKEFNDRTYTGHTDRVLEPYVKLYPVTEYNMKSRKLKKIISVSNIIKERIETLLNRAADDIAVIPNGVDLEKFNPQIRKIYRKELREKHHIADDDFVLLFVGYYHLRKGLHFLIESLILLPDKRIKVVVVGDDPYGKGMIDSLIRKYHLEDRVIYTGNQTEAYRYFSIGDALLLPTLYEPFGNVVLEGMACGLPPVLSKLAGASDLITDGENGFLLDDPTNLVDIAAKIKLLSEDPRRLSVMSMNALKTAVNYSWDSIADQTLAVFESTMKRKQKKSEIRGDKQMNYPDVYRDVVKYFDACAPIYKMIHIDLPYIDQWQFGTLYREVDVTKNPVILDLGTGDGNFLLRLGSRNPKCELIGYDLSEKMIEEAGNNLREAGLKGKFIRGNMEKIELESQSADYVVSNGALHHVQDKLSLYSEIFRVLKPGGKLFVCDGFDKEDPEYEKLKDNLKNSDPVFWNGFREDFKNYHEFLKQNAPSDLGAHPVEFHLSPFELKSMLESIGFSNVKIIPSPQQYAIYIAERL